MGMATKSQSGNEVALGTARGLHVAYGENTMTEKITVHELAEKLIAGSKNGFRFAELYIEKELTLLKKDRETKEPCPYKKVVSCYQANVGINFNYEKAMRLIHGEDWEPQPRKWGTRRGNTVIVDNGNKVYATAKRINNRNSRTYADGKPIHYEELANFLPKRKDNPTDYREYDLSNVKVASIDGKRYEVTN
jgi:hypothetical protein